MNKVLKVKNSRKLFFLTLALVLILQSILIWNINKTEAAENNTTWILHEWYNNPYLKVVRVNQKEGTILLRGTHNTKTSTNYYKTDGFVMTTQEYTTSGSFPSNAKNNRIYVESEIESSDGATTTTLYTLKFEDIVSMAGKLGITGESIGNGTVPIYLHTIYDIYKGNKRVVNDVIGVQEMLNAPVKYRLGYTAWNPATQEKIPSYYNMRFDLSVSSTYEIEVIAVDAEGNLLKGAKNANGDILPDKLLKKQVIFKEDFSYDLKKADKNVTLDGVNFTYSNSYYEYTNRSTKKNIKTSPVGGNQIEFNSPDAMPGSILTVYLVYKKEDTPPYYVDIIAETEGGKKLTTIEKGKKVEGGSTFEYSLKDSKKTLEDKYYYANKWYLTYTDKNGKKKTDNKKNSEKISQVMPEAMAESTAVFHMIYSLDPDAGDDVTPPEEPEPGIPEITIPKPDYKTMPFTEVTAIGSIRADDRSGEKFVATLGVPTTESLYGEIKATDYLIGYNLVKKVGLKKYPIKVKKDYNLVWEAATPEEELEEGKEPERITETVTIEQVISVPRAYGYWEIKNFDYYTINTGTLNNYALPNGSITLTPNSSYYDVPSVSYYHSRSEDYHIIPPKEVTSGITFPAQTITGGTDKPMLPKENFTKQAYAMTGNIKVRSDRIIYDGATVMSDKIVETDAPDVNVEPIKQCYTTTNENVLYKPGQVIEATKDNGDYGSVGSMDYKCRTSDVSSQNNILYYPVLGINNVVIHTPVLCDPIVEADNDKYVQLLEPDKSAVQLVLDKNNTLSDFTVKISNTGSHSYMQGYFTRDFSKSLRDPSVSYIATDEGLLKNQVKFPFDVYVDIGMDGKIENDDYIPAETWITLGRATARFYLPMWVDEGIYTADFRTVAVNCTGKVKGIGISKLLMTEEEKNTRRTNYVATNTVQFEVSGRIYGLNIYDLTDYPLWEEAFRKPNSSDFKKSYPDKYPDGTNKKDYNKNYYYDYALGTNDQYGNDTGRKIKYTFPLVNGSHPFYKNIGILKPGYLVRFSLETTGSMYTTGDMISIKPSFYFVDKNGKNRTAVDLYYSESFNGKDHNLVKVGSKLDLTNIKEVRTGDINHGIPENELRQTAAIKNIRYGDFIWHTEEMFTFSHIRLTNAFRTFVGNDYANTIKSLKSYKEVKKDKVTENDMIRRTQRWYGKYYLPNYVYAVKKGYDVFGYSQKVGVDFHEDFWLKDGYIIINLKIETIDHNGKKHLSYINTTNYKENGNCCMWVMEGPPLEKKSYKGPNFKFYAGDFFIYYANKKASDDYSGGAIY